MNRPVIFFDWDGTLADSMDLCYAEVAAALKELGYPPQPLERIALCNGPTIRESAPLMGVRPEDTERYFQERTRQEVLLVPEYQRLFPGVRETLERLSKVCDMVIVSNGFEDYIRASVHHCGLDGCFQRIQAAVVGKSKSQLLAGLLEELKPEKAAMVGDRAGDVKAGCDNGLPTAAVTFGYGCAEEWQEADAVLDSVQALEEWLKAVLL